jgi:flavin reductase (DIM6/NTAB) family NADH-FMN oxidoreductase RutF
VNASDLHSYQPKDGHGLKHDPFNAIIGPRPIGWVSSRDENGHVNLIGFSSIGVKDSTRNMQATGEFVWNLATMDLAKQMNATAAHVGPEVDEFTIAGLTAVPSTLVNVPRVGESRVAFECKVTQIIELKGADGKSANAFLTMGEVVAIHIDKSLIVDGVYQTALAGPILRAGRRGDYFHIKQENMFEMNRPD